MVWRRGLSVLVMVLAAAACGDDDGAVEPPTTVATGSTSPGTVAPVTVAPTFDTARLVIRRADGTICELCTYAARNAEEWRQGLMGVTDLAGHDGMIFEFDEPAVHTFWMKDTVMPLSAAWFAGDGTFAGAYDMAPCPPDTDCSSYGPQVPITHVLEVPQGDLAELGIGDGSVLEEVAGSCTPT